MHPHAPVFSAYRSREKFGQTQQACGSASEGRRTQHGPSRRQGALDGGWRHRPSRFEIARSDLPPAAAECGLGRAVAPGLEGSRSGLRVDGPRSKAATPPRKHKGAPDTKGCAPGAWHLNPGGGGPRDPSATGQAIRKGRACPRAIARFVAAGAGIGQCRAISYSRGPSPLCSFTSGFATR